MKQISFDGRIGKDAEVRTTKGGKAFVRFSVANNSFVAGQDKTEWFDVTSYDNYVIENRVKYLTKGTYVIISGGINTEVAIKDGKVYVNQYVTASNIDTPSFKRNDDASTQRTPSAPEPTLSTYTGGTPSVVAEAAAQPKSQPKAAEAPKPQPAFSASVTAPSVAPSDNDNMDNELPF